MKNSKLFSLEWETTVHLSKIYRFLFDADCKQLYRRFGAIRNLTQIREFWRITRYIPSLLEWRLHAERLTNCKAILGVESLHFSLLVHFGRCMTPFWWRYKQEPTLKQTVSLSQVCHDLICRFTPILWKIGSWFTKAGNKLHRQRFSKSIIPQLHRVGQPKKKMTSFINRLKIILRPFFIYSTNKNPLPLHSTGVEGSLQTRSSLSRFIDHFPEQTFIVCLTTAISDYFLQLNYRIGTWICSTISSTILHFRSFSWICQDKRLYARLSKPPLCQLPKSKGRQQTLLFPFHLGLTLLKCSKQNRSF